MSRLLAPLALLGFTAGLAPLAHGQTPQREASAAQAGAVRECKDGPQPNIAGFRCFESANGWFIGPDSAWASAVDTALSNGAARFEKLFGKSVGRGILVYTPVDSRLASQQTVKDPRARWTWPWMAHSQLSIAFMFSANLHELGHLWLSRNFPWKKQDSTGKGRYGSVAADWLDETAAVIMEGPRLTQNRRTDLIDIYRGKKGARRLAPLDTFFTAHHRNQNSIYEQSRGFIDFFLERTGDSTVFNTIAENEATGAGMAEWLRANGPRYRLPATVKDLDKEWQSWLARQSASSPPSAQP